MSPNPARFLWSALTAACLVLAAPAVLAADPPEAVAMDAAFKPAEQAARMLALTDAKAMQGLKRVAVPLFTVEFVTADAVSGSTSGFGAAGRATSSAAYKLVGVGEADFQALTDTLYTDFLRDLQASGVEVVPREQWQAAPAYAKLAAGAVPAPIRSDSALTLAPAGMAIYGAGKAQAGAGGGLFGAIGQISSGFGAVGAALDSIALAGELGPAGLIEVQMRVHFVTLTNHNTGFLGRMAGSAKVSGQVMPLVTSVTFSVQSPTTRSTMTLKQPLAMDASAFKEVREEATTAGDVAGAVLVGLLQLAVGSKDSSSSARFEAVAEPARYREVVGAGLGSTRELLLARLRAER
jgi:hypothetical protein